MNLQTQSKLDEETLIQEAARDNARVPSHDCQFDARGCCETCERYWEARDFWAREEIKGEELSL
mgnify:CR=1 FL=1